MNGSGRPLRLGTRTSQLALIQSELIATALRERGTAVELVPVVTAGDRRAVDTAWGEGAFVGALRDGLRSGELDLAVHSAKDVPIPDDEAPDEPAGADPNGIHDLIIAAYVGRADPRDALVSRGGKATLAGLPAGTRVGTDSPRRTGFVLAVRPDLVVHPLAGNVDTRLRRLDEGATDALVLAVAGLERLGRADRIDERLDPAQVPPAPAQGALAVEVRAADVETRDAVAALDDPDVRRCVTLERAVLQALGGGCRAPVGALARLAGDDIELVAGSVGLEGTNRRMISITGPSSDRDTIIATAAAWLRPTTHADAPPAPIAAARGPR